MKKPENYPNLVERKELARKLFLYRFSSFEVFASWALFKTKDKYWVRRVTWDRSLRFPSYEADPHTFGCEVCIFNDLGQKLLLSLSSVSFNPFLQLDRLGIGGTIHGIEVGNHTFSSSLQWWCSPPEGWKALDSW